VQTQGKSMIYNDDCLKILPTLPNDSIDLVLTDPPYRMTSRGNAGNSGGMFLKDINKSGKVFSHNDILISEWLPHCYRVLKDSGHIYIMTNHINLHEYLNIIKSTGFHFIKSLIWNKGNKIMSQYYMSQFEYILFCRKGFAKKINNCGTADIIDIPNKKQKNSEGLNLHDTEKPVGLMKVLIENSSIENETVLDPFMGIGSTIIAAKNTNRKFIGIEMDKNYFDIAKNRIETTLL
jgi:site-specific DNA-methyltransferase (adenine-specific)